MSILKIEGKRLANLGKWNTLFGKLIISFVIVVTLVTCIIGIFAYLFFSTRFNHEIETVHQKVIEQVADTFKFRVSEPIVASFMSLSTEIVDSDLFFHFYDNLNSNHYKLYQTREELKKIVSNHSDIFSDIQICYRRQNIIVSAVAGVSYLSSHTKPHPYTVWLSALQGHTDGLPWIESKQPLWSIGQEDTTPNASLFTFVRAYPMFAAKDKYQGIIAIDVPESAISKIIQKTVPSQYHNTLIMNAHGKIISHPQKSQLGRGLGRARWMQKVLASPNHYDSFISRVNGKNSVIAFASLPYLDWKVVNITPLHQFYQSTIFIQQLLMVICLLAILIGLIISLIFTRQIYNPLTVILQKVRLLSGAPSAALPAENEYGFITRFIDEIAVKVQSLQATEPVIKNNLMMGLLYHRFLTAQEFTAELKLLGVNPDFSAYWVMLVQFQEKAVKDLTHEKSQTVKNSLIREIEAHSAAAMELYGIDLPDRKIGVIIGRNDPDPACLDQLAADIIRYLNVNYRIPAVITAGTRKGSLLETHQAFQEAALLFKYQYFYPHQPLLTGDLFLPREQSRETLPDSITRGFSENLRRNNLKQIETILALLVDTIQAGIYSADHCRQRLLEITRIFSLYIKEMQYKLSDTEMEGLQCLFAEDRHIADFTAWITGCAARVFQWNESRINNRNYRIVADALAYIAAHLDAADLSLDAAAAYIHLSPGYFSRIFKEVTGVAFTTYINDQRLEKARDLLLETTLPVQEIGLKVGFNAAAYFIKQFKTRYNYTPNDYRRQFQTNRNPQPAAQDFTKYPFP